jgi:hypothetical protein
VERAAVDGEEWVETVGWTLGAGQMVRRDVVKVEQGLWPLKRSFANGLRLILILGSGADRHVRVLYERF